jgi:hypothetical protein
VPRIHRAALPVKVVIFGPPRSGTTALFYVIKAVMPARTRLLFEPREYAPGPRDDSVLAKVLSTCPDGETVIAYPTFFGFDRKVVLTRDPRDWIVSGVLFLPQEHETLYRDRRALGRILDILRRKERDPRSVSVKELLATVVEATPGGSFDRTARWLATQLRWFADFEPTVPGRLLLRYEDLVDGRLEPLESYLGRRLDPDPTVPPPHDHVTRSKRHGSWRHWFTAEDIEYFRPLTEPYLQRYGYSPDWTLADEPAILPAEGSRYVARTARLKRWRRSVPYRILARLG